LAQTWQVLHRPLKHLIQRRLFDAVVFSVVLPGGADEHLAVLARLYIERNGILRRAVRALEITQFHDLMMHEAWVSIRNDQVAFAFSHWQSSR
jgi:hypothetical protein